MTTFKNLKPGDKVHRMLQGDKLFMTMVVVSVTDDLITCDAIQDDGWRIRGEWTFDPATGVEIDDDLGWGPKHGATGSYLKLIGG